MLSRVNSVKSTAASLTSAVRVSAANCVARVLSVDDRACRVFVTASIAYDERCAANVTHCSTTLNAFRVSRVKNVIPTTYACKPYDKDKDTLVLRPFYTTNKTKRVRP